MSKHAENVIEYIARKGCEMMDWSWYYLDEDARLCAADYYIDELIDKVGEQTPTGKMWMRYQILINKKRASIH